MALLASGTIRLSEIRNEFKAPSGQVRLGELYRGQSNGYVPNGGFYTLNQVPAPATPNPTIRVSNFYNTTKGANVETAGRYNEPTKIFNFTNLPANVDRIRIVVYGGGGAGKIRVSTGIEGFMAGGGGAHTVGYFSGVRALRTQYGSDNLRIVYLRGQGGGPVVYSETTYDSTGSEGLASIFEIQLRQNNVWVGLYSVVANAGRGGTWSTTGRTSGNRAHGGAGGALVRNIPNYVVEREANGEPGNGGPFVSSVGFIGGVEAAGTTNSANAFFLTPPINGGNGAGGGFGNGGTLLTNFYPAGTRPIFGIPPIPPEAGAGDGLAQWQY